MAKQRTIFIDGAMARQVDKETASYVFDLMEKFAGYGFNKSHSAAYALVAYQTAWLKTHYPAAFMAAVLSSDMDNTDKVVIFINESIKMGLKILPPSINSSCLQFTVFDEKTIYYGLGAIKGVGASAISCIVNERQSTNLYTSLFDFCRRLDLRKVNRRVLEALIKSGAMDEWQIERSILFASLEKALKLAEKNQQNETSGQTDLFAFFNETSSQEEYLNVQSWTATQRLNGEKETLGLYLTGHPITAYSQEFNNYVQPVNNLKAGSNKKVWVCALVTSIKRVMTKRGKKLHIVGLEDATGKLDGVVFSEVYEALATPLQVGQIKLIEGDIDQDNFSGGLRMMVNQILTIAEARNHFGKSIIISLTADEQSTLPSIKSVLSGFQGDCLVQIQYSTADSKAMFTLGQQWRISPSDELIQALESLLGKNKILVNYY